LIVPLFIGALRRAEDLVLAMEARCYVVGESRTSYFVLNSRRRDWFVVLGFAALFVLVTYIVTWPPTHAFFPGL